MIPMPAITEQRVAPDLESAYGIADPRDHFKADASRMLQATPPTRPPGGGRARPGLTPGGTLEGWSLRV